MIKKYNKAVFFDIDGTLIELGGDGKMPPQSAKQAIEELRAKGCLTMIATGRANAYIPDIGIDVDGYISFNGAVAYINGETVFEESFSEETTAQIIDFFQSRDLDYLAETVNGCYFGGEADKNFYWIGNDISPIEDYPFDITKMRAAKVSAPYNDEKLKEFGQCFGDLADFILHRYDCFMDIGPKGVNKGTGVKKILKIFNIVPDSAYAFGDDTNDLEMLEMVGHAVAMTPHAKCLG